MKTNLLIISFTALLSSCYWIDDFSNRCKEESAIWGTAESRGSSPQDNCEKLRVQFLNTGTTIDGVVMRAIIGRTGDGPKAMELQLKLTTGEDIRSYDFRRPLKLSLSTDKLSIESSNPDIIATFDSGFTSVIMEKLDIEIDQKRRDLENYRGYIKCEGTYFKGFNLDGSLNYEPFKYDLKFDTDNN